MLPAVIAAGLLLLAACGSGERDFDAATLIAELNGAGAGLELGPPLESGGSGTEVTVVTLSDAGRSGATQTSGAIVILGDAAEAEAEFDRCESALSFVCFRAANAVLRFTGISAEQEQRISAALTSIQTPS